MAMKINALSTLAGQRAALRRPPEERAAAYAELVMEPMRPLWEPMVARMGQTTFATEGPFAYLGLYPPGADAEEGLRRLDLLDDADSQAACVRALELGWERLTPLAAQCAAGFPEEVLFSLGMTAPPAPAMAARNMTYGGFGAMAGRIMTTVWPTDYSVARLPGATAHELNHNVRFVYEPFNPMTTTVGQYIVAEGLGEAFATELFGEEVLGPYAQALDEAELGVARDRIGAAIDVSGFDVIRGYIFGDWAAAQFGYAPQGLPDFAGYTVGYQVVRAYCARTGLSVAEATFRPWREIVERSGYFTAPG